MFSYSDSAGQSKAVHKDMEVQMQIIAQLKEVYGKTLNEKMFDALAKCYHDPLQREGRLQFLLEEKFKPCLNFETTVLAFKEYINHPRVHHPARHQYHDLFLDAYFISKTKAFKECFLLIPILVPFKECPKLKRLIYFKKN